MLRDTSTVHVVLTTHVLATYFHVSLIGPVGLVPAVVMVIMKATQVEKKTLSRLHLQKSSYQMSSLTCLF